MNIVLIGIMGSGKTSVGMQLSKLIKYDFIDIDHYIERNVGKSIKEIFIDNGEEHFRNLEKDAAKELGKLNNTVISTGGGAVLSHENMINLKENAVVIYLHREVSDIIKRVNTKNRPLLKDNPEKLYAIAKERAPLYKKYTDIAVSNSGHSKITALKIQRMLKSGGYLSENNANKRP